MAKDKRYFLTVDWCNKGKRGIFSSATGSAFAKDSEPHDESEIWDILNCFSMVLSPKSIEFSETELKEYNKWYPLGEFSNQYGVALKASDLLEEIAEAQGSINAPPEFPAGKQKRGPKPKRPTMEEREGFSSRSFTGQCELCWRRLKDHPICQACGALVGSKEHGQKPSSFRDHILCGSCLARWKKLDLITQWAEGREATWNEMLKGLHPSIALRRVL